MSYVESTEIVYCRHFPLVFHCTKYPVPNDETPATPFGGSIDGFAFFGLRSTTVELRVVPELGARVTHLTCIPSGREWMWRPDEDSLLFRNQLGDGFAESTKWGLDECLPTIGPCHWRGRDLPDHGEAWSEQWDVDLAAFAAGKIATRLRLPISPMKIERTIELNGDRVILSYALTNLADEDLDFLWSLHPLLTIQPDDQIQLPPSVTRVTTFLGINCSLGDKGTSWAWPNPIPGVHVDQLMLGGPNTAIKCFTPPLSEGWAAVENQRSGDYLRLQFDANELNTLGIWINRGGWSGYHHVAIEPTNGAPDPLDEAVSKWGRYGSLRGGETRQWQVTIEVGCSLPKRTSSL